MDKWKAINELCCPELRTGKVADHIGNLANLSGWDGLVK